MVWVVGFYANSRQDSPVEDFISNLDDATVNKVLRVIDLLKSYGKQLTTPYSKHIEGQIYELRTSGKNPVRILYCWHDSQFVLLNAFKKKTNKLPHRELNLAKTRLDSL